MAMIEHRTGHPRCKVRNAAHRDNPHTALTQRDGLEYCAPAHSISADSGEMRDFSFCLVAGACEPGVDTLMESDAHLVRGRERLICEPRIIGVGHIDERRWTIPSDQGISPGEVDVIADQHQRAGWHLLRRAACGVRQKYAATPKFRQEPDPEHHVLWLMPFVQMHATLETCRGHAAQNTNRKPARVARDRRRRHAWDFRVGNYRRALQRVCQVPKPRTQDQTQARLQRGSLFYKVRCFL